MIVQATVNYPVMVYIEIDDNADTETIQNKVLDHADKRIKCNHIKPIIHDSPTHPEIID